MDSQSSADMELDDMTECSICTEVFTDPRVLPCIHTFCLKCLQHYGKDGHPGYSLPCPLCRKEFTIPDDGLSGIQKNFFMEKLLHVRKLSARQEAQQNIPCDVCSSDEASASETVKPASMYCLQCQQNYCEQCSLCHSKMKSNYGHTQVEIAKKSAANDQVEIGAGSKPEEMSIPSGNTCDQHKGKQVEVFCQDCQVAVCLKCVVTSHRNHHCSAMEAASEDLRKQILSDSNKIFDLWKKTGELLPRLEKKKNDVIKHLASIEDEINTEADKRIAAIQQDKGKLEGDKLIAAIERDRMKLLSEVESIRRKRVKQLDMVKQELEQHMVALEGFKRYSETLLSSGTACDVTRSANSLHDRAVELMKFDVIGHVDSSLPPVNVTFTSSTLLDGDDRNLVRTISEEGQLTYFSSCRPNVDENPFLIQHILHDFLMNYSFWFNIV